MSEAEKGRALEDTINEYKTICIDLTALRMELAGNLDVLLYVTNFLRSGVDGQKRLNLSDYPNPDRLVALVDQIRDLVGQQDELYGQIKAKGVTPTPAS